MKLPRNTSRQTDKNAALEPEKEWSPYYGLSGMVFEALEVPVAETATKRSGKKKKPVKTLETADPPGSCEPQHPVITSVELPAVAVVETGTKFTSGPSGMVFDGATDTGEAAGNLSRDVRAPLSPGSNLRVRYKRWFAYTKESKALMTLVTIGAILLPAAGTRMLWRKPWPSDGRAEDHWFIGSTAHGHALIARKRESGYGTVSVRVDVISSAAGTEQWQLLVACPDGRVEYRSGERWADKAREFPLGLDQVIPKWEAKAATFACGADAIDGPWPSYEAALPFVLARLQRKAR